MFIIISLITASKQKGCVFPFYLQCGIWHCVISRKSTLLSTTSKRILVGIDMLLPAGDREALSNLCCREDYFLPIFLLSLFS